MSSIAQENEIVGELVALLDASPGSGERNAVAPQSASSCVRLLEYLELRLNSASFDVERTAWSVIGAAAYSDATLRYDDRQPLKAAKYLLGLASEVDLVSDTGMSFVELRRKETKSASATLTNNKRLRQRAAAWAASFGGSEHAYNTVSLSTSHGEKNLNAVALELWNAIKAIANDDSMLHGLAVTQSLAHENRSNVLDPSGTSESGTAQPGAREPRRVRRLLIAGSAIAVTVALVATVAAISVGQRGDVLAEPTHIAPGDAEYWEAYWGPEREVFSLESGGSPYPSFNSITDNPNIGDERNFVGLRQDFENSSAPNVWSNDVWGDIGDEFFMRVYVHNSGDDSNGVVSAGWLQGARLQVGLSRGENETSVFGLLSAKNATTVWDGATIHYPEGATVEFEPDFRKLENNVHGPDGLQLGPDVFETGGALLGYDEMDGVLKPGYQYDAYVVLRLVVVDAQAQVGTAIAAAGWGPQRDAVSVNGRTPQITINSMIDNPVHGDERNFFQARPLAASNEEYRDTLGVEGGETYVGYVYFNNNSSGSGSDAVAEDVRLSVLLPGVVTGSAAAVATISSSNSAPQQVWDSIILAMPTPALAGGVQLVPDSVTLHTSGAADGAALDNTLFSAEGALLGCDAVDGRLAPGPECAGYVTFRFVVDVPDFSVTAGGRPAGDGTAFSDAVRTSPGAVVQVQVSYENTGSTQQDDVVIRVPDLPEGVRYLEGSTEIANSVTGGAWNSTIDGIASTGINVGSYAPGGEIYVRFNLMVSPELSGSYGWIEIRPLVRVETSGGFKSADLTLNLL